MGLYKNLVEVLKSKKENGIIFVYSDRQESLAYEELFYQSLMVLGGLEEKGLKKGDELIFQLNDNKTFLLVFWACLIGKIIPVPVSVGTGKEENIKVFEIWKQMKNPFFIYDNSFERYENFLKENREYVDILSEWKERVINWNKLDRSKRGIEEEIDANDIAYVQFSSGSTSAPKGVVLTHYNLLENIKAINKGADARNDDILVSWMPLTHDMGLIGMHLCPMAQGTKQYNLKPALFVQKPFLWLDLVSQEKATIISSPNFGYHLISDKLSRDNQQHDWNFENVRLIFNGAEPISYNIVNKFLEDMEPYGLKEEAMFPVYGMAEASLAVSFPGIEEKMIPVAVDRRYLSIGEEVREAKDEEYESVFVDLGYSVDSVEFKIVSNEDEELGENRVGHILIRGTSVTSAYYRKPEITKQLFDQSGWLRTGDIGFVRNNRLIVIGRSKDMLIVNGINYYCVDLERILEKKLESVGTEVAVCGKEEGTPEIIVFLKYRRELSNLVNYIYQIRREIYLELKLKVAHVIPVKKFPITTSGKVQRYKLLKNYKEGIYDGVISEIEELVKKSRNSLKTVMPENEIESNVKNIFESVIQVSDLSVIEDLHQYGMSSTQIADIFDKIENMYKGKLQIADLFSLSTVREIANIINNTEKKLNSISLPEGILNNNKTGFEYKEIQYYMNENAVNKLELLVCKKNMSINQALCAMYLYSLWDYSKTPVVNTYVTFVTDKIANVEIDMDSVDDIDMLFERVKNYQLDNVELKVFSHKKFQRMDNQCVALFGSRDWIKESLADVLYNFTIILNEKRIGETLNLYFGYNAKEMSKDKAEDFFRKYLNVIQMVLDRK